MRKNTLLSMLIIAIFCYLSTSATAQNPPPANPEQSTVCGDANCDGAVNVLDVITMINHIMSTNPQPFCPQVADINADGAINVLDVIGAINIIMQVPGTYCPSAPTVITTQATDLTATTATIGGNVTHGGGNTVTERGVYWGTQSNPQTTGTKLPVGSGLGQFSTLLSGLTSGTTYHYVAYATNSVGTAFGQPLEFSTLSGGIGVPCPDTPTVTDIDGNTYNTVLIDTRCWIKENLKTIRYNDETAIEYPGVNSFSWLNNINGAYAWYDNNISHKDSYGALYNWHAVNNIKGLCPTGWHVPTQEEWIRLTNYLGGIYMAGGKLKSIRTAPDEHPRWDSPNTGATNETDFSALPGGLRNDLGIFYDLGKYGNWWSGTEYSSDYAWYWYADYKDRPLYETALFKECGFSVRCIKTAPGQVFLPIITTTVPADITASSATVGGDATHDGGVNITERGIYYGTDEGYLIVPGMLNSGTKFPVGSGTGQFTTTLTGLPANTAYYFVAYATNSVGTAFGTVEDFTTLSGSSTGVPCPGTPTVTDIDGNTHNTVLIGTQCWMAENLKSTRYRNGTSIAYPGTNNSDWQNNTTGAYAWYDNNETLWKNSYGALYNWYAAVNSNGLCPTGWHLPTDAEWTTLITLLEGEDVAGGKLKSTRTSPDAHPRWDTPNTGATNVSGFSAFSGGNRSTTGTFPNFGYKGHWWASTEYSPSYAWYRSLSWVSSDVTRSNYIKNHGFSVRCLRD